MMFVTPGRPRRPPHDPVSAIADGGVTGERLADLGAGRLALMDEQGVDVQVLSLTTPGLHNLEPGPAVESARRVNDLIADACARHPARFQGFAALPTSDPDSAPRELERAVKELGLKGALLCGRTRDRHLDHIALRPMLAKAAELGVPLFIHPQTPAPAVRASNYSGISERADLALAAFGLGWHYEAGLEWVRLAAAGVFDELPALQIILGHWGEVVLFYLERTSAVMSRALELERSLYGYARHNLRDRQRHVERGLSAAVPGNRWSRSSVVLNRFPIPVPTRRRATSLPGDRRLRRDGAAWFCLRKLGALDGRKSSLGPICVIHREIATSGFAP